MVLATYETKISCSQPQEVLQAVMENAVDRYLSLHPTVFPIDRQDLSINLKVQKNYRSKGEILTISIAEESFYIASESITKPHQLIAWGKNRDNVLTLSGYVRDAIAQLSYSIA